MDNTNHSSFLIELNAFVCLGWQLTIAVYVTVHVYFFVTYFLVLFEALLLHPSQQFLAMSEYFPGLKMKYLAQGHATVTLMRFQITTLGLRVPDSNQLS